MGMESNLPCGIEDVIHLLGIRVIRNTGTQLHCRCPFCDDHKAHLNVRLDYNVFRCNRCGKGGGVLHLYAFAHEVSLNTAYEELCRIYQSGEKPQGIPAKSSEERILKVETQLANSAIRDNTYSNLLSLLSLGATHRESLLLRGLSGADINGLGYKTTPAVRGPKIVTELLERGCILEGVPGFYRDMETGQWKLDIRGSGIMVPDRNAHGEIEAIQIRLDNVKKSKYNNLTSVDKYYGTTAACCPHFVGVTADTDTVYLTEGVLKADVAYCLSSCLQRKMAFVGLTGVGNINQCNRALDELNELGIHRIRIAFDMDERTNDNVRMAKERVILAGLDKGYDITPIRWPEAYKGIDDLLRAFKQKAVDGE
jgi:hypothetical protein